MAEHFQIRILELPRFLDGLVDMHQRIQLAVSGRHDHDDGVGCCKCADGKSAKIKHGCCIVSFGRPTSHLSACSLTYSLVDGESSQHEGTHHWNAFAQALMRTRNPLRISLYMVYFVEIEVLTRLGERVR
jgi:hypothetical protein